MERNETDCRMETRSNGVRKIGTATIIINRCMQTSDMPRISRAVAMGFPYLLTPRGNYH